MASSSSYCSKTKNLSGLPIMRCKTYVRHPRSLRTMGASLAKWATYSSPFPSAIVIMALTTIMLISLFWNALGACRRKPARAMRRVQMRGGARWPHARRTLCTLSVRSRAPYLRRWALIIALGLELIPDGQAPDPLARRREDRIAERRRDRWHAGLAHAAHRLGVVAGNDVHAGFARRPVHARDLVGVEIVLLGAAALERHLAERRDAHAHGGGSLHLGAHAIRIDGRSAVHRDVHARDRHGTLVVDRHFHDRRDVAHEAV